MLMRGYTLFEESFYKDNKDLLDFIRIKRFHKNSNTESNNNVNNNNNNNNNNNEIMRTSNNTTTNNNNNNNNTSNNNNNNGKNKFLPKIDSNLNCQDGKLLRKKLHSPTFKLLCEVNERFKALGYRVSPFKLINSTNDIDKIKHNNGRNNNTDSLLNENNNSGDDKLPTIESGRKSARVSFNENDNQKAKLEIWLPRILLEENESEEAESVVIGNLEKEENDNDDEINNEFKEISSNNVTKPSTRGTIKEHLENEDEYDSEYENYYKVFQNNDNSMKPTHHNHYNSNSYNNNNNNNNNNSLNKNEKHFNRIKLNVRATALQKSIKSKGTINSKLNSRTVADETKSIEASNTFSAMSSITRFPNNTHNSLQNSSLNPLGQSLTDEINAKANKKFYPLFLNDKSKTDITSLDLYSTIDNKNFKDTLSPRQNFSLTRANTKYFALKPNDNSPDMTANTYFMTNTNNNETANKHISPKLTILDENKEINNLYNELRNAKFKALNGGKFSDDYRAKSKDEYMDDNNENDNGTSVYTYRLSKIAEPSSRLARSLIENDSDEVSLAKKQDEEKFKSNNNKEQTPTLSENGSRLNNNVSNKGVKFSLNNTSQTKQNNLNNNNNNNDNNEKTAVATAKFKYSKRIKETPYKYPKYGAMSFSVDVNLTELVSQTEMYNPLASFINSKTTSTNDFAQNKINSNYETKLNLIKQHSVTQSQVGRNLLHHSFYATNNGNITKLKRSYSPTMLQQNQTTNVIINDRQSFNRTKMFIQPIQEQSTISLKRYTN